MGKTTTISWTDRTFNPWWGCTKVGPGCDACYAAAFDHRLGGNHWGPGAPRRYFGDRHWNEPHAWNRAAAKHGVRYMVFCASMADVFDNEVEQIHRDRLWKTIRETPNLDWQIVTKRIGNAVKMLPDDWGFGYPNVWIIATMVNQDEFDRDWPKLMATPARIRGLSIEPMIGDMDLSAALWVGEEGGPEYVGSKRQMLHWVICGGESKQRPNVPRSMPLGWARNIMAQCKVGGVAFHMKQLSQADYPDTFDNLAYFPKDLQVREFPGSLLPTLPGIKDPDHG